MSDTSGKDGKSAAPVERGKTAPEAGPVGRTRSEEQRRRLIVTGLATPALMTLPSRRVWATKCSKSKMLSGNMSAKKAGMPMPDCEPMGCGRDFWTSHPIVRDVDWAGWSFDQYLFPGATERQQIYNGSGSMQHVVSSNDPPHSSSWDADNDWAPYYGGGKEVDALRDCAREAAAAWLNAYFISWPPPNDMFNFEMTTLDVEGHWQTAVGHAMAMSQAAIEEKMAKEAGNDAAEQAARDAKHQAKDAIKAIGALLMNANQTLKTCPF